MEVKTRVYVCTGCGIGECVDMDAMAATLAKEFPQVPCAVHPFLCGEEGVARIKADIEGGAACPIVIGACSARVNTDVFDFGAGRIVERANLRELMAWRRLPDEDPQDTLMLALDIVRMGIAKAQTARLPEPASCRLRTPVILVVGGGVTGMKAALDCAEAGYDAALVERSAALGGYVGRLYRETPRRPPYENPEIPIAGELEERIKGHERIRVFTQSEIKEIAGQPGQFDVAIVRAGADDDAGGGEEAEQAQAVRAGAIILATGARAYDVAKVARFGYGSLPNVITHEELEAMARQGRIVRPSDGQPARRVAFIQCAGSRDAEHLPYCSSVCCLTSLKQALYIRERDAEAAVYIFHRDMRTPGMYERFYLRAQRDPGLYLTKGDVTQVTQDGDGGLLVHAENALLGESVQVRADLVVLATGMTPATLNTETLHLRYRQGPDAPVDRYGFPNSNFICFPYETRRTGIYAAGAVRQPMDVAGALADAAGAALKAIQCVELTGQGAAVHPRAGDLSFPDIDFKRCTQCKRCTEECPFGALDEDAKGTPQTNYNRCRRCGICMGACPERIVNFADYSVHMVSSMIKAVEVPDEFEEKPRVLMLVCENDAWPAFDLAGLNRLGFSPHVRIIPVRCLGSVNVVWIKDALARGYDGIVMIGCKYGDDYQCHFIKGSELMNTRSDNIAETLKSMAMESERVRFEQLALDEYGRLPGLIAECMETVERVGFNPFKGM